MGHSLIPTEMERGIGAFPKRCPKIGEIVNGKCMISVPYYFKNVAAGGMWGSVKDFSST